VATPIGPVGLTLRAGRVVDVSFFPRNSGQGRVQGAALRRASMALKRYFQDPRARLGMTLAPSGTAFQQRVWRALRRIPPGRVKTYGELARALGTSARAVGGACRANPIPILIPCHRVVSARGDGGFMGMTRGRAMTIKRRLLEHERSR